MKTTHLKHIGESELAALNASADAEHFEYADDWSDAAIDTALDCATLCDVHSRDGWDE
jgi:hypothetical protein